MFCRVYNSTPCWRKSDAEHLSVDDLCPIKKQTWHKFPTALFNATNLRQLRNSNKFVELYSQSLCPSHFAACCFFVNNIFAVVLKNKFSDRWHIKTCCSGFYFCTFCIAIFYFFFKIFSQIVCIAFFILCTSWSILCRSWRFSCRS